MHGVTGKPPGAAQDNAGIATSRIMLLLLVAMTGVAPISLYMLVPALPVLATTFGPRHLDRADDGVALHGRHRLFADHHGAAVGSLRTPSGAARRSRPDGGRKCRLHLCRDLAAIDRGALSASAGRRHRHGGEPRHHPRSLQPRAHQRDDQPGDRRHDDRADAEPADRRPAGDRVRLARDLLRHHRRIPHHRRGHRVRVAGDAPRPRRGRRRVSRRCRPSLHQPRLHRLRAVPGAGLADHLHLRRRRALYRGHADGPLQRRIRRVVCDHRLRLSDRQPVLRALRAAPFAGKTDLVRAGAAIRRRAC